MPLVLNPLQEIIRKREAAEGIIKNILSSVRQEVMLPVNGM